MKSNPSQKLIVLAVDPMKTQDLTSVLEQTSWWGDGWNIQQVSLSPYGKEHTHVFVAVVLNQEREGSRNLPPPSLG